MKEFYQVRDANESLVEYNSFDYAVNAASEDIKRRGKDRAIWKRVALVYPEVKVVRDE